MRAKALIVSSSLVIGFAIADGAVYHWRPVDIWFFSLVSLQALLFVGYNIYEARWGRRLETLPPEEKERELAKLSPEQRQRFYELQNEPPC